jgi:hypothetical protein
MIRPTEADIGRKVVYRDPYRNEREEGVISSLPDPSNPNFGHAVWVRFKGPTGEMTPLDRLEWI